MKKFAARILIILIFSALNLFISLSLSPSFVFAQSPNLTGYCSQVASLAAPADGPNPTFIEPKFTDLKFTDNKPSVAKDRSGSGNVTINSATLPFAKGLSDYFEGSYQDESHRLADLRTINSVQFQPYNGPTVELLPQKALDVLRTAYVSEIMATVDASNNTKLEEATFDYADVCGQNRRSIKDLVSAWGLPKSPSQGGDLTTWQQTWQRYWPKIPTSTNYFSQGCIEFVEPPTPAGTCSTGLVTEPDEIRIGVPDAYRLNNLSTTIQQLLVPQNLITGTFIIPPSSEGTTGLGSKVKFYDSAGNLASQVSITPAAEDSRVAGVFPFFGFIWTKLIGTGAETFAGALPGLAHKQDLTPEVIEKDAKVTVEASEDLPIYVRFLGGVENLANRVKNSLYPKGAR